LNTHLKGLLPKVISARSPFLLQTFSHLHFDFVLTSDTILYAEILATKENLEIIGFYHSHPDCEACLSQEDQKYVMPEMSYPVISVSHGRMQKFGCWEQRKIDNREVIVHERIIIKRF
jgi:proteasome lid subunit RPN8/RPN11